MRVHAVTMDGQKREQQLEQWYEVSRIVDYLHLRFPKKHAADVYDIVCELIDKGVDREKLIVHDRLDVSVLLDLPNVQLGFRSPPVAAVRRKFPDIAIGVSVHAVSEAMQAAQDGANYVIFGHVFETRSKAGKPPRGLPQLEEVVQAVPIPVIAIGGIHESRVAAVAQAGAHGIAVQSGIFAAADPLKAAVAYKRAASRDISRDTIFH